VQYTARAVAVLSVSPSRSKQYHFIKLLQHVYLHIIFLLQNRKVINIGT